MTCCGIWEKFNEKDLLIKEYDHWKLLLKADPNTLGNCVVVTKRHMEAFSEITDEEMKDFAKVIREFEKAAKKTFNYDKINYLMLMMKDNHTHFHIFPRYKETKEFAGEEWKDPFTGRVLDNDKKEVSLEVLNKIKEEIKKNL